MKRTRKGRYLWGKPLQELQAWWDDIREGGLGLEPLYNKTARSGPSTIAERGWQNADDGNRWLQASKKDA